MAWGLSLVGATGVVFGWVVGKVVLGEVLVTWLFVTFYVVM